MHSAGLPIFTVILLLPFLSAASAQKGGPGGGQQNPAAQGQGQSLGGNQPAASGTGAGLTWPRDEWDTNLVAIDRLNIYPKDTLIFKLCYQVDVTIGSLSTVPFVFTQVDQITGETDKTPCIKSTNSRKPLMMNGLLVVAVDARHVPTDRMRSITLNLTTQQGSPIYPNPIRPSPGGATNPASAGTGGANFVPGNAAPAPIQGNIYYLVWPQQLQGDVIPTVSLNLVYTPPMPGSQWTKTTVYPEGSIVTSSKNDGHYYTARVGGISGSDVEPAFKQAPLINDPDNHGTLASGGVQWIDSGSTQPSYIPTTAASPGGQTNPAQQTCCCPQAAPVPPGGNSPQACPAQLAVHAPATLPTKQLTIPAWTPGQTHTEGDVIYVPATGHYYTAANGGKSGDDRPDFVANEQTWTQDNLPTIQGSVSDRMKGADGNPYNVEWEFKDSITSEPKCTLPAGLDPTSQFPGWSNGQGYVDGNCIDYTYGDCKKDPSSCSAYFQFTGDVEPYKPATTDRPTFSAPDPVSELMTGRDSATYPVLWKYKVNPADNPACSLPSGIDPGSLFPDWSNNQTYSGGNCIRDPAKNAYFQLTSRIAPYHSFGTNGPEFSSAVGAKLQLLQDIQWEDSGTSPPPLVTSGQPADQTASLNYAPPQVHSRYYFNLTSGVVVSSVHNQTFGWDTITEPSGSGATAVPGSYMAVRTGGSVIVDPVLFFSAYLKPMDAESAWKPSNLTPSITFGLSLTSPSSNFYFGGSSEFLRNIQVVYGLAIDQQAQLATGLYQPMNPAPGTCQANCSTSNATPPATTQSFKIGGFIGISYNITGFIQSLFGGGGSKGAAP